MEKHLSREIIESFGFVLFLETKSKYHNLWFKLNGNSLCWYPDTDHVTIDSPFESRVWDGRLNTIEELMWVFSKTDLDLRTEYEKTLNIPCGELNFISSDEVENIIDNREPLAIFYTVENNVFVSIYNLDGNATVEDHKTKDEMLMWLFDYDNVPDERKYGE